MKSRPGRPARAAGRSTRRNEKAACVLVIPSQTGFLGLVRDVTTRMAETAGFEAATAEQIALAVDEATTNVLEHAYRGATDRTVELRFEDRGRDFRVDVVDTGATVNRRAVPRVDLRRYARERRKGGLGVHLMEKIMDSVTFRRRGRSNVCCLVKDKTTAARG